MICIQILLPVRDATGRTRPYSLFSGVQDELTAKFGGVTAFVNAPAKGRWQTNQRIIHDDIVVIEVMTTRLNRAWWKRYKRELAQRFEQKEVVVRAVQVELL